MRMFQVNIAKAKAKLDVDFDLLPPEVKLHVIQHGLDKLLNAATAKETKAKTVDDATREANSMVLAQKKLENLIAGQISARKAKETKVEQVVTIEARRQAMFIVKANLKAAKKRIGDFTTKALTEAANLYLSNNPALLETAKKAVEENAALAAQAVFDVNAIAADPKLIAKNEAKKAEARAATEAKNAGKPGSQKSTLKTRAKLPGSLPVAPKRAPAEVHA